MHVYRPVPQVLSLGVDLCIRSGAGIATAAVGVITRSEQCEDALQRRAFDVVLLARQLLRDPYWPLRAAQELEGATPWPVQYLRAVSS